jgi:hypothetical protein
MSWYKVLQYWGAGYFEKNLPIAKPFRACGMAIYKFGDNRRIIEHRASGSVGVGRVVSIRLGRSRRTIDRLMSSRIIQELQQG